MRLRELLGGHVANLVTGTHGLDGSAAGAIEITAVVHDTADVEAGALFCCVRGARVDGHHLAGAAVAAGAAALLVDHLLDLPDTLDRAVPQVEVADVRAAMGPVAARFWGDPSESLAVIGVTGTAGKTTVTHLVQAICAAAGRPCGVIGTLSGPRTTPDATELQQLLAEEIAGGSRAVAMEVSSHGLDLHRVDGTRFAVAIFTNLSRDHLDYHATMDDYYAAKARLFSPALSDRAVVCADDPWGRRLLDELASTDLETHPYRLDDVTDLHFGADGARFTWRGEPVELALPGRFNVLNALAAATAAAAVGIDPATIAAGLGTAGPVPGRFEPVDAGQPFTVLVDYSHKPDALEQALNAARELAPKGRLTVLFGCGGDKDTGKRPIMGEVAARLADRVVLTSDNPRSEDPLAIIDQIRAGVPAATVAEVTVEPDRRTAVALSLASAGPGDLVLVAGKGHETTQTIGDEVLPFDDRAVAREVLAEIGYGSEGTAG
ncbi:MAG TPA: UDP-N-acetylmuramoyl-L-alanyl-D-glutamate--2,6-diaminopimelate ligase [Acidimicrobiales bacterium]|nr:UDP-N-acetylmuramoyl-L-alanyl-D-glutamate--2,6-diaminopimelate ligase [Acidimicrobiales bacterium]